MNDALQTYPTIQYTTHSISAVLPKQATASSAGYDLFSPVDAVIHPGEKIKVDTGLKIKTPEGFCAKIYSRSGLAFNHGITVTSGVAIIDSDYRGPIYVALTNCSTKPYNILRGDRIAQMLIERCFSVTWEHSTTSLAPTARHPEGFGSTGR